MATAVQVHGYTKWEAVTPHDSANFATVPQALVATGADGTAVLVGSDDVTMALPMMRGVLYEIAAKRVNTTGTTSGMDIYALYTAV